MRKNVEYMRLGLAVFITGFGALASGVVGAAEVNMWDGQWHYDATLYVWVPWLATTVKLPPIAGGDERTIETQPSQYLGDVRAGALIQGTVRKGDWSIWTDLVYMSLSAGSSHTRLIGLPGGDPTLPVTRSLDSDLHAVVWTLAPAYTVLNNDTGTLDVLVGLRYTSVSASMFYTFTAPPTPLKRSGGFSPSSDSTDALIGLKGLVRLSPDGKWFLGYEADVGDGNNNWQYNAFLAVGYRFDWGDVGFGVRNLTYQVSDRRILEKVRMTGPLLGAALRW